MTIWKLLRSLQRQIQTKTYEVDSSSWEAKLVTKSWPGRSPGAIINRYWWWVLRWIILRTMHEFHSNEKEYKVRQCYFGMIWIWIPVMRGRTTTRWKIGSASQAAKGASIKKSIINLKMVSWIIMMSPLIPTGFVLESEMKLLRRFVCQVGFDRLWCLRIPWPRLPLQGLLSELRGSEAERIVIWCLTLVDLFLNSYCWWITLDIIIWGAT